jgi:anti-anti-sigma factor
MDRHAVRQDAFARLVTSVMDDDGGPPRVMVAGELDLASAVAFGADLARLIDELGPDLVLDVSFLKFCDARGLAALVAADRLARGRGGAVTLTGARPQLAKILRVTGLDRRFVRAPATAR